MLPSYIIESIFHLKYFQPFIQEKSYVGLQQVISSMKAEFAEGEGWEPEGRCRVSLGQRFAVWSGWEPRALAGGQRSQTIFLIRQRLFKVHFT